MQTAHLNLHSGDDAPLSKESALFWLLGSSRPLLQVGYGEDLAKVHVHSSLKHFVIALIFHKTHRK